MKKVVVKVGKKNLKIIAATAMSIFSLFAATVGAFAWFTGKIQESNQADQFSVMVNNGRLKNIYFHKSTSKTIDDVTRKPTAYTFNSSYCGKITYDWQNDQAIYSGDAEVAMEDYSPLDFSQPILLVFELQDAYELTNAGEVSIQARTDVQGFLGARDENNAPVYGLTTNGYYYSEPNSEDASKTDYYYALSSVVDFLCNDSSSELYNKNNGENTTLINTTYQVSNLRTREQSKAAKEADPNAIVPDLSFASINNNTDETSFKQDPSIYKSQANTTVRYISIVVDYYSDALDYIYSTYLGDRTLEDEFESHLEFLCDWGLEIN